VDLPCIVEGMKSWDRRGWYKSADICQMLLVLGRGLFIQYVNARGQWVFHRFLVTVDASQHQQHLTDICPR
jgi:TATA-binding protein-associated factor Taf7